MTNIFTSSKYATQSSDCAAKIAYANINKKSISRHMEPNRFLSLWVSLLMATLAMLCPQSVCAAGATSTEINNAIVLDGSISLAWENDAVYPWILESNKIQSGNPRVKNSSSKISLNYNSKYPTYLVFKYDVTGSSSYNKLKVYIDGVKMFEDYGSSNHEKTYRIPKGNHVIEFCDTVINDNGYAYRSFLYDVKVTEYPGAHSDQINEAIVQDGSLPLVWTQDENYPWRLNSEGKLCSGNWRFPNSQSTILCKYSSQYPSYLVFKYDVTGSSSYNKLKVYIDGVKMFEDYGSSNHEKTYRIPKGNHVIEFCDTVINDNGYAYQSFLYDVKVTEYPGAHSDQINEAIVQDGSLPLVWTQDENYPWQLSSDNKLYSGNWRFPNSQSSMKCQFNSHYPATVIFKYDVEGSSRYNKLKVYIDGVKMFEDYGSSNREKTYRIPKGNHVIEFCDTVINDNGYAYCSYIYDLDVTEPPCATADELNGRLTTNSVATVSWENDQVFPFGYNGNILTSSNSYWENTTSSLKGYINLENPSVIKFDWRVGYDDYNGNHIAKFYVDGVLKFSNSRTTAWSTKTIALPAGEHTLHWEYSNTTTGANYWMQLKDLSITSDWVEVESSPGMLGVETLYKVNRLQDVNFLKVKGGMNDADWQVIKQMVNLYGLDLSDADITTFPASFNSNANFGYIVLPETLKQIPDKAFTTCNIHSITIPSSVTKIGNEAFASTNLGFIDFADNSQLTTIGYKAFYSTKIREFIMPNSVTEMYYYSDGSNTQLGYTFANCYDLNSISFSNALSYIPRYACYNCKNISEIHFPDNLIELGAQFMYMGDNVGNTALESIILPYGLEKISKSAFCNVKSLKNIIIPETVSYIGDYAFYGSAISNIEFPISVTTIGAQAFRYCPLEVVSLPSKLRILGQYAFANNSKVKRIVLPSGITNYDYQFSGCANIETIECLCATPPAITNDPFSSCTKSNVSLKVPQFAVATYKLDPYWYQFDPIIEGEPTDYWKIIGDLKLLNNRRMDGKPDVDLYYGGKLTVKGDAAMPIGKFDIYTSEGNPSSFVTDCSNITADEINTIFSVDANKWYFLTPMVDVDLQQVIVSGTTNYVFRYYDGAARADIGAGTSWKNVSDMKLKAGVGYIFQCNAAGTLTFPVPVNLHKNILTTEAVTLPLTPHPSDNKANKGWNYVGNPFPSYFDIYYMDFTAPITVWNGSTYKAYSITDDNFVLRPMQGFFVQKPDAVDNIVLQTAGRQIESTVNRPNKVAPLSRVYSGQDRFIFNIEITSDTLSDATRIVLNENASTDYEIECDASKFMSMDENVPQIYSIDSDGNRLAINERPAVNGEIALGVYIPNNNETYSISANRIDGEAYLYDAEMKITHNLNDGDYNFSAEQGVNNNRFSIMLKGNVSSSIDEIDDNMAINIIAIENGIEIRGATDKVIKVVNMEGITVYSSKSSATTVNVSLSNGIYIVNVENQSYKVIVK